MFNKFKSPNLILSLKGNYGTHINVYDWENKELVQKIDLGMEGVMPLEIRLVRLFNSMCVFHRADLEFASVHNEWQIETKYATRDLSREDCIKEFLKQN